MMRYQLHVVLFFVIVAGCWLHHASAQEQCDRWSGPAGAIHCISFLYYNGYQWATCRTNAYIQTTSKNQHKCRDQTRIYCYYQCMLDVHGKNTGSVYYPCSCTPGDPLPTQSVKLPIWCYSPDGSKCDWYRECLNKVYPQCENNDDDYAIKFAEKFCELYSDTYKDFSSDGKKWVDAVRKCLQVKLVPLIDKNRVKKCSDLKDTAFKTHTPCYLKPDASSPSYCDLPTKDQLKVFWTIKSAFVQAFWPSLEGLLEVMGGCIKAKTDSLVQEVKNKIERKVDRISDKIEETKERINIWLDNAIPPIQFFLYVKDGNFVKRRKRSSTQEEKKSQFAGKIIDAIAVEKQWEDNGVVWFAYANETQHDGIWAIRVLVADRHTYQISGAYQNPTSPGTQPADLKTFFVDLSTAVRNDTLNLYVDGHRIKFLRMDGCLDWNCNEQSFNVLSLNAGNNAAQTHKAICGLSLAYAALLCFNFLFSMT